MTGEPGLDRGAPNGRHVVAQPARRRREQGPPVAVDPAPAVSGLTPGLEGDLEQLEYWTARDVSALLKISVESVFRLARRDSSFPALRLGSGTIRFPKQRLLRWLRDREQGRSRQRTGKP